MVTVTLYLLIILMFLSVASIIVVMVTTFLSFDELSIPPNRDFVNVQNAQKMAFVFMQFAISRTTRCVLKKSTSERSVQPLVRPD